MKFFDIGAPRRQGLHCPLAGPLHRLRPDLQEGPHPPHAEGEFLTNQTPRLDRCTALADENKRVHSVSM